MGEGWGEGLHLGFSNMLNKPPKYLTLCTLSLYKFHKLEIFDGVLNLKWGISKKLLLKKQDLPEHKIKKTTEIYTHVSTKNLSAIKNPLDNLLAGGET